MDKSFKIVIPVFNSREAILDLLSHLVNLSDVSERNIVVIDDASTDGTADCIIKQYSSVTLLRGNGSLFWCGGIHAGMEYALSQSVSTVIWLNHDCFPKDGSIAYLIDSLRAQEAGCISGFCRVLGLPEVSVSPGFKDFKKVMPEPGHEFINVDGVNGNFVAISRQAIDKIGLPDPQRFPHYGDTPYTLNISRAGMKVLVATKARADLNYEFLRRLTPFWRVYVSNQTLFAWLGYFFFSFKSRYHLANRFRESLHFRGAVAPLSYLKVESVCLIQIVFATLLRAFSPKARRILTCVERNSSSKSVKARLLEEIATGLQ